MSAMAFCGRKKVVSFAGLPGMDGPTALGSLSPFAIPMFSCRVLLKEGDVTRAKWRFLSGNTDCVLTENRGRNPLAKGRRLIQINGMVPFLGSAWWASILQGVGRVNISLLTVFLLIAAVGVRAGSLDALKAVAKSYVVTMQSALALSETSACTEIMSLGLLASL
jgi:hypothetical protein